MIELWKSRTWILSPRYGSCTVAFPHCLVAVIVNTMSTDSDMTNHPGHNCDIEAKIIYILDEFDSKQNKSR